jgi:hypothetical protein
MFSRSSHLKEQVKTGSPLERGVAIIEMAIIMPVLTLILMAIIDLGIMMIHYMTLTQIAHEGVRLGASMSDLGSSDKSLAYQCDFDYSFGWPVCIAPGSPVISASPNGNPIHDHNQLAYVVYRIIDLTNYEFFPFKGTYRIDVNQSQADSQISVQIEATYNSFFRTFENLPIVVAQRGPYLFE